MKFGVGQSVPRKEDPRLVTGGGKFTDDINLPDQVFLAMFRSPSAHGVIKHLEISAALEVPGVLKVYTAADLTELGAMPCIAQLKNPDGSPGFIPRRSLLAEDKVAFVGQPVAAVIAESAEAARDAAERVELELEDLPANTDLGLALHPDTAVIHSEHGSNLCVHYENGDPQQVEQALAAAAHRVEFKLVNNRVAPSPLEPRACVGEYVNGRYQLHNPSQGAFAQQRSLANALLKVDMDQVRVVSLDTGGGFGIRGEVHPEAVLCLFAARALTRPVKFTGDRSEMFLADSHGRDNLTTVTAGFDDSGALQALKVDTLANLGAYCTAVGPFVPTMAGGRVVGTIYAVPHVLHSVRPVFTNSMPVAAYRGAGRPEAAYVMERLFDTAAVQLGLDALELRKRNFIRTDQMPYTLASGIQIHSGAFADTLDKCLVESDWKGFPERKRASEAAGKLRGRGVGCYVESSGGGPEEEARITINGDGSVDVVVGTFSHGQGHRTTYAQILSEKLGVDFDAINVIQGDTDQVKFGGGTGGSRSSQMGGVAVLQAAEIVLEDALSVAADLLQSPREEVSFADGVFQSASNQASATLAQVASAANDAQFGGKGLHTTHRYDRGAGNFSFPNGAHMAEVEIDPETGVVEIVRYTAVDDCGRVINPLLAAGQVHGGVAMGIGQALYEDVVYDATGQLLTGSLLDYCMPRASQLPDVRVAFNEVLDPNNPLGVKGIGEGGACGAPPAVVNAVLHALRPLGIHSVDMPLKPERIWRAIKEQTRTL